MNGLPTQTQVKRAIILAGGQRSKLAPLTSYCPAWMFPVLNKPIIEYTVDSLRRNGFEDIIIALPEEEELPDNITQDEAPEIRITYYKEERPRGTAGILKDLEKFLDKEPFIVINCNLFVGYADLAKFIEFHIESGSVATVGVHKNNGKNGVEENVTITEDKAVKSFHIIHSSMDRRSPWRPSGIYIFDPSVLRYVYKKSYMDIKEQLIPALQREALNVSAYQINGSHFCINSTNDYVNVHRELLLKDKHMDFKDKEEIAKDVWVGKDVIISPNAYLLGPIVIGDGCSIKDGAQIIGPTVIGNGSQISEGVLVRESILWDGTKLSNGSRVEYSIVGKGSHVPDNFCLRNMIALNGLKIGDANLISLDNGIKGVVDLAEIRSINGSHKIYKITKRIMDVVFSAVGIILFLPLFLLIAIAIKIDSAGPVFYKQKRCGIGGKLFRMLKFRTMVDNAESLQTELLSKNEVDGPLFKISNDPRITKLGRILRKTSLDEIPQLFNVLKGKMSLVGPRPLIMDEMKFSQSWRDIRLTVKPGITGLWQIEGRSEAPFHDWIRYDVYYVRNQSLLLDMKILFKTIKVVFKKVGAY
ncbi:MAG: exopolysaccharide biosynthesis polyprenyl glycosylphosphotransferase [Nitrospirota bacterium]